MIAFFLRNEKRLVSKSLQYGSFCKTPADGSWALALSTANDMDMGTAARTLKKTGNKDLVMPKDYTADRALPVPVSLEAVNTAPDVHEPVFAAVQGREGQGANQLPLLEFCGTNRAGLGIPGSAFKAGLKAAASPEPYSPSQSSKGGDTHREKEGIAKPEQDDPYNNKNHNFKYMFHSLACLASWRLLR